jgi:hypothetical protein
MTGENSSFFFIFIIDMFNNFVEILEKFTVSQRIGVLVILVLTVLMIYIGPKYLELRGVDVEAFEKVIQRQRIINQDLNNEIYELNVMVIENQKQCTKVYIEREKELYEKMVHLEQLVRDMNKNRTHYDMRLSKSIVMENDSIIISENVPMIIVEDVLPISIDGILREVQSIKEDLVRKED